MEHIFLEISLVIIVATACATAAKLLKQPIIPAYILAGVLLGPLFFNVIKSGELLETLSTFGIAFLLFLVGIELDLRKFLKTGKAAIIIGVVQMAFAAGLGYLLNIALGFEPVEALFLAVALGFSSTIVGLKLIGEKKELDTLYGQIVIGLMLTQDFIAVLVLLFFNVFVGDGAGEQTQLWMNIGMTAIKGFFLFALALLASKYILKRVFTYFARSPELLFLGAISWCLLFALLAITLGFSIEVGSLLAGVSLSFLPYNFEISYRIKSLRDFFLPVFFAVLGGQLVFTTGFGFALPTIIFSGIVLFIFPLLVIGMLLAFGYRTRTSFQAGTAIGQVSEFSFIVTAMAFSVGIISQEIVSLVALIGLVTMTLSTYMIEYNDYLYNWLRPLLKKFERKTGKHVEDTLEQFDKHIILFGYNVLGHGGLEALLKKKNNVIVVDNNPSKMFLLKHQGTPNLYGSMSDEEVLEKANIHKAAYCVSTVRSRRDTLQFLKYVRLHHIKAKTIVTAFYPDDAMDYYDNGADYVVMPTLMASEHFADLVKGPLGKKRAQHKRQLEKLIKAEAQL